MRAGLALLLCAAAGAACLGPIHPYELREGVDPGDMRRAYLAPMNATSRLDDDLLEGADRVHDRIAAYLEENGCETATGDLYGYRQAWDESFRGVDLEAMRAPEPSRRGRPPEPPPPPPEAMAKLFAALGGPEAFDALVVPDLLVRPARLNGAIAYWDGVRRKQESTSAMPWRGDTRALSLRVRVFGPDGELWFEGIGGLDMLFRVDLAQAKMMLVSDILGVPEHIEEGVAIAFHPFYGIEEQ